ncbi:MAG: hypothetical protein RIQ60_3913 [Pseudomonadota bacterium]|jgi:small Trp-rich protein
MVFVVVGVLLVLLRTAALWPVADLSWWYCIAPFGGAVLWWAVKDGSGWTKREEMRKDEEKKAERRRRAMAALGQGRKSR